MSGSASCSVSQGPTIQEIQVNGVVIDADQISKELQYHPAESAQDAVGKAVEALVIKQVLLQRAQSEGISGKHSQSEDENTEEAAIRMVLERNIPLHSASEDECKQYYKANQDRFYSAPLMEVSHILLAADFRDFEARQEIREKAEKLIEELQGQPEMFAERARLQSSCPSKEEGGSLGQITKGQTTPEFEKQVFLLDEGLCASPIESRYGCHVVNVNRKVEGELKFFDDCKGRIKQYLEDQLYAQAVSQYISILVGEADVLGYEPVGGS